MTSKAMLAACLATVMLAGCVGGSGPATPRVSDDMRKGGQFLEPWLGQALTESARHPLGSKQNPVRADMPQGQRAYLARLRCSNGSTPTFERVANLGAGVFGSIIDQFDVRCQNSAPLRTIIIMDMYFTGHVETRPVKGFTLAPP
jgi:hypothetical protein